MKRIYFKGPLLTLISAALLLAGCGQSALVATATPDQGSGLPAGGASGSAPPPSAVPPTEGVAGTTPPPEGPVNPPVVRPVPSASGTRGVTGPIVGTSIAGGPITSPPLRDMTPLGPPTVGPPMTPDAGGTVTVGMADAGRTVMLHTGDTLLVSLGSTYDWTVKVDDPSILGAVSAGPAANQQGPYKALKAGHTTVAAVGDPPCAKATPPCGMPSRVLQFEIVVQ